MPPKSSNPELIARWQGAADYVGLHPVTIKRFEREGTFPSPIRRSPRRVGWLRPWLDEWLAARPRRSADSSEKKP
jgi:predicted DNA-binding transcriptional regulator AlpA